MSEEEIIRAEEPVEEVAEETVPAAEPAAVEETVAEPVRPVVRRYNKRGVRRGKYGYAAPIGVLISLLSIVGVVALVFGGIRLVENLTDTTALQEEVDYFLEPIKAYNPAPFEDIATAEEQDAFLYAAAYKISLAEQVRMLREGDENTQYNVDDAGRIIVPAAEMGVSYASLFGPDAPLTARSIKEDTITYSAVDECYHVPYDTINSGYRGVIESFKKRGDTYTVRMAYVSLNDIELDERGKELPPDPANATYTQIYTLRRADTGLYLVSCEDGTAAQ